MSLQIRKAEAMYLYSEESQKYMKNGVFFLDGGAVAVY